MGYAYSLLVLIQAVLTLTSHVTWSCPSPCRCLPVAKSAHCSRKKLPYIPEGIPADIHELYLNTNEFDNPELRRSNFSTFKLLRNLYINDCGIEHIRQDTFADLKFLRHLDLSNNRLRAINDYTFRGLTLDHLFLGQNPGLHISTYAFAGLHANGLHLQGCALKKLHIDVIKPLNGTVKILILEENDLETFSREWQHIFGTLNHLRIGHNPFHCNCEIRWLHKFFVQKSNTIFAKSVSPSCRSPSRLRGQYFSVLQTDEFTCNLPVFKAVDVDLGLDSGELFCQAQGDPTPTIMWILPSGKTRVYLPPKNDTVKRNQGRLSIQKTFTKTREVYVCVANNPAGNVTMNLTVTWPPINVIETVAVKLDTTTISSTTHRIKHKSTTKTKTTINPVTKVSSKPTTIVTRGWLPPVVYVDQGKTGPREYEHRNLVSRPTQGRHVRKSSANSGHSDEVFFSLVQLVSSIVGTFVLTLLVCVVLFHLYYRRQTRSLLREGEQGREKTPENVYVTSEMDEQTLKMVTHNQRNQMREQSG